MKHSHNFVEKYQGMLAFGMERKIDEDTVICYLQKFSDDELMKALISRLSDDELEMIFQMISHTMKKHFTEPEYHRLFLKD
jgi:phosphoribosylamine-glycine ligase